MLLQAGVKFFAQPHRLKHVTGSLLTADGERDSQLSIVQCAIGVVGAHSPTEVPKVEGTSFPGLGRRYPVRMRTFTGAKLRSLRGRR